MYLYSVSKNGVSAKEVQRHLGVTYKTAWRMCKQIRVAMRQGGMKLSGVVEADETYLGARNKKTPILGALSSKRARAVVTDTASAARTKSFIPSTVQIGTTLHTDESPIYHWTKADYYHKTVHHSIGEYVRDGVHTNTIEGFWGQLKRSIDGTYHHVSRKYLQSYLDEFVFRYSYRDVAAYPVLLERASKRVLR